MARTPSLEDPRSYLHFIPWKDLTSVDLDILQGLGIHSDVPPIGSNTTAEWVLWTPPYPGFAWNHHLHTEDEVYEYSLIKNWPLPDHYLADQVVFGVQQLEKTDFISGLTDYWNTWVSSCEDGPECSFDITWTC
jgi:hypothetical protein